MERSSNRTPIENAWIVLPVALVHSAIYRFLTSHSLSTPRILEPTWIDRQIPFADWTVWPYLAMVIICIVAPMLVRNRDVFRRLVVAYVVAVLILATIYIVFPTAIQRPNYGMKSNGLTWFVYRQFAEGLGTACAFPSGHIVFPMLGCWALYRDRFPAIRTIALLTALSSVSILSIKEHVAWDWIGGVIVGLVAIVISERWSPKATSKPSQPSTEHSP